MDISLVIPAFIAGLITFLAPCTLPLVPGYLGFISGVSADDLNDPQKAKAARKKILLNGAFFILGFSIVFILFGILAGFLGQSLATYRIWMTRVGGVFVILFGIYMTGLLKFSFLEKERKFNVLSFITPGKPKSSCIVGMAFALGWTPCVGPVLGSILVLASTTSTALQGGFLLAVFCLGLAVPFLAVALGFGHASAYINKIAKYLKIISVIGGLFLILIGILLVTNNFIILIEYGYRFLDIFNYNAIVEHL